MIFILSSLVFLDKLSLAFDSPSLLGQANARDRHERWTSFLERSPLPFRGGWDEDQVTLLSCTHVCYVFVSWSVEGVCWRGGCGRGLGCAVVGALGVVGAGTPRLVWKEGKRGRVGSENDTAFF